MNYTDVRDHLPLRIERLFEPWSYELPRRRLELRTGGDRETGQRLCVVFYEVMAMQVRRSYRQLVIAEATDTAAIDRFAAVPERISHTVLRLAVGDDEHQGFVVCAALMLETVPFEPIPR
ncbi:hypothetical protein Daura_23650 [Dactylosporangium aurantiacum]|uniref:Uncharacterized protein n=1 Tax=Dactylosporangium aurantiacum TaxID=35754 RepID=A0A9Q9ING3_9ACTN|nr:hypothetical protein [Dactylosporangium aurantiacum]MDG6103915.1 hypothetical protein [Dactylosporangium aurantiacum]UWZ58896.1 hypothetical protein Daura_23650 [Dactylosporangium aurantiacum]